MPRCRVAAWAGWTCKFPGQARTNGLQGPGGDSRAFLFSPSVTAFNGPTKSPANGHKFESVNSLTAPPIGRVVRHGRARCDNRRHPAQPRVGDDPMKTFIRAGLALACLGTSAAFAATPSNGTDASKTLT